VRSRRIVPDGVEKNFRLTGCPQAVHGCCTAFPQPR
jgi:hypothetical protein